MTRWILHDHLDWSYWSGTKNGQKTLLDWEKLCLETIFRFAYTILKEKIHKNLIVNMNQTSIILVPRATNHTYKKKRVKQVPIYRKNKKTGIYCCSFWKSNR